MIVSFSEYGCKDSGRTFEEVATLYSTKMTGVFSGGLAYEYSLEQNGFGVVQIKPDGSVVELEGFPLLAKALRNNPMPEGNGGYKDQGGVSECPNPSKWWLPKNSSLPRLPGVTESYFKNGAGEAKGNKGTPKCSHWCGRNSTGLESPDSPNASGAGTSKKPKSNANSLRTADMLGIAAGFVVLALF
jgi:1,3-beta-glucanosyltransferase GAS5